MDYHFSEELNRRSVYLRLLKKLWIVPAAAALCALAGFLIYTGCVTALSSHQRYEQTSKFYIEFSVDERGNAYDYYNAATWDDLLFAHPALREVIEQGLPDGMTMEDARSYVLVDLYSDIRLMTVVVTAPTADGAAALTDAISRSLKSASCPRRTRSSLSSPTGRRTRCFSERSSALSLRACSFFWAFFWTTRYTCRRMRRNGTACRFSASLPGMMRVFPSF